MARYTTGYRFGGGDVVAVVRPGTLVEQWRAFGACIRAGYIVITQAANTGLTGGSTPHGHYDSDVILVSTSRLDGVHLIQGGRQVICLPGATLHRLERILARIGREPHSVIGSSCIGASVIGGVCNNSGGSLVQRGPAYTEYALYAQVTKTGEVELRNHLGIRLGDAPESILTAVEAGRFQSADVEASDGAGSDDDYHAHVRAVDADTPARYNADPRRLFEASGSAGRIMVFAVRLDTFPKEERSRTFYVGSNDTDELTVLRRRLLTQMRELPISGEYMHRGAFDIAADYGKDIVLAIRFLGTNRMPIFFAARRWIDRIAGRTRFLPPNLSDHILQALSRLFPGQLPTRMREYRRRFEHHLILKVGARAAEEARAILADLFPSATGDFFECTSEEATRAFLHRFAVAGAAIRYRAIHSREVEEIVALDVALRRNDRAWFEALPTDVTACIVRAIYYGHFLCHVFHQDYLVRKGTDHIALEHRMWALLDARGAEYPAEHNVGHIYYAKPALLKHYRDLDPQNRLNPGIGRTSRIRDWA